ncbi:UNVERIFIED_CONTAM: hypothetical protein FKN15_033081 [Acipenser sinensis]
MGETSKQAKNISELKSQMAQILEYLAPCSGASDEAQDAISITAFWDGDSFAQQETEVQEITQETGPSSKVTSETGVTPSQCSQIFWRKYRSSWYRLA